MKSRKRLSYLNILPFISIILFLSVWIISSKDPGSLIPSPIDIYNRYLRLVEKPISKIPILGHIWASLQRVLLGLLYGTISGVIFGLLVGWSDSFRRVFKPLFEIFRPIPALAWIPLMTIWFGIGETSKITLVALSTFMPIAVNTYAGVNLVPSINLSAARLCGANKLQIITSVVLPSSLSAIIAGIKTALGTAWMVVLAAEMISAKSGLGFMIIRGSDVMDMPLVIFAMLLIGIIGALLSSILTFTERKLCPWKQEIN